jgi:ferric-chelate reductase (NADPH)
MAKMVERLADLTSEALLSTAQVTEVSWLSPNFVKVELQADKFGTAAWTPGAKLQFRPMRGTLGLRTYTPIDWDGDRGVTRLIAYTHSEGSAAGWFRQVTTGDVCEFLGPRRSLDLRGLSGRVVFVGDESSVALACAQRSVTSDVRHVFEAADSAELTAVLDDLGFADNHTVVPKSEGRGPLLQRAREAAEAPFDLVVSGDAATVHAVRRGVRQWPSKPESTKAKAYWAKGRTGLD